ncbi:MAG: SCO1664 family protein [Chloroflexi bacterium]|nr:SCO1664 family protein [Chloroflexota bacterium]
MASDNQVPQQDRAALLTALASAPIRRCQLLPWGSNYTYLLELEGEGEHLRAIYKPGQGERPLWDFPAGTLYLREWAAYVTSQALGWDLVPPTVVRAGPQGPGSVQLYVEFVEPENYFTLRERRLPDIWPLAVFDLVTNNADRKGGHCLVDQQGHIWGIDHGLTFHALPKLRTVMWEFCGQPIPRRLLEDVRQLLERLSVPGGLIEVLGEALDRREAQALCRRMEELLRQPRFPLLDPRQVPWPLV